MNPNDRSIVGFTMLAHAIVHTYELSIPILLVVWLAEFSTGTAVLGTVVAVGYGLFGFGALPGGVLVDRYGSRRLVAACLAGMGGSFLALSRAGDVVAIALALGAWGIAASVYHPAGLSLISTGVERRGTGFAYHGMAGNLGIAVGPFVTALLLLAFDWRTVAGLLAIPAGIALAYALTVEFDETAAVTANGGDDMADRGDDPTGPSGFLASSRALFTAGFTVALLVVMTNGLFYRGTLTFLPDVLSNLLPDVTDGLGLFESDGRVAREFDLASYLYAGLLMVGVTGQYVGGKLTDRIRVEAGLAATLAALAVVAIAFVPVARAGLASLLAVSATLGFLIFGLQPLYQATIAEYSPPGERGLSYGFTYLSSFGVGAAGAAVSGYLLAVADVGATFLVLAAFPALGSGLALALLTSDRFDRYERRTDPRAPKSHR